jgi:hypothetical protein
MFIHLAATLLACSTLSVTGAPPPAGPTFSWQESYARVLPHGDLEWTPKPFQLEKRGSLRFIDFDSGNDENDGTTREAPWKHHPWDSHATAKSKLCSGNHTYIFKGGVDYRGELTVREAGKPGDPIRLTRDPNWGQGPAVLSGSERITGWKKGAQHQDTPEPEKVWWADLSFSPRALWLVRNEGDFLRIPLARTPNWKSANPDDVKSQWWTWDNPAKPFGNTIKNASGALVHLGIDTKHIRGKPEDYFKGALIWPEFGWVMSQPYPTRVEVVDLKNNGLGFAGWTGGGTGGVIMRNMRYYLEDKPHYLDDPDGEFWFEKKGEGGRLYLRLPHDADPNVARIEAGKRPSLINGQNVEHLEISGLTFRFKNYHFNNIAWGKSKDAASPLANCSAFQEIISYQNTFFQNTVFNFHEGSRRQAPTAGRNKYLGNIWDGMGKYVFRHADPARTKAEGNARDAGQRRGHFALETNAYARNVVHDFAEMGILEPSGRWLLTFDDFKAALQKNKGLLCELGEVSKTSPLRDPARGDFRPVPGALGINKGVKVFVPWSLCGVVGEWNFYPTGDEPAHLIDEHWYMTDYHVSRDEYFERPMYPLKGVNIRQEDYVPGPLEDWIKGALSFSPAKKQFATISNAAMMTPFSFRDLKKSRHENARPELCTISGEALKNPQIYTSSFLIEVYFKTAPGHTGGVLMEKMKGNGYSLTVRAAGKLDFNVKGASAQATAESKVNVNDGQWHHAVVEADRRARALTVYVDGKKDASAAGIDASVSLANEGDIYVGGTPAGLSLDGALDFLRIAQGTLSDAETTIEELYAWEFDGPQFRDFTGRKSTGARSAGAITAGP